MTSIHHSGGRQRCGPETIPAEKANAAHKSGWRGADGARRSEEVTRDLDIAIGCEAVLMRKQPFR